MSNGQVAALTCTVCRCGDFEVALKGLLKCTSCSHVTADITLSDQQLYELYQKNYFHGEEYADYLADQSILQRNFEERLRVLDTFLEPGLHRTVVEIGCAYGFFLDLVRERFDSSLGVDVSEHGINHARNALGLEVVQDDFLSLNLEEDFYLGCLWDTIEHLKNPRHYVEHFAKSAKPGSLLAITTGDIDSWVARFRKHRWRMIHPPTHLHYFSRRTLERLLEDCGFEIVFSEHAGYYRSFDLAFHRVLVGKLGWRRLFEIIPRSLRARCFYLNLFDILFVVARKQ